MIPMRDGAELFTAVYQPKHSAGLTGILIDRTPYMSARSENQCSPDFAPAFDAVWKDGYILVLQSIRGRYRSQGKFVLGSPLRPRVTPRSTDEATDASDTANWLIKHVRGNNGKVAFVGVSYDAMLAIMAATTPNPSIVAISAQASPINFWVGDDFWRNGAFRLNYGFEYAALMELGHHKPFPFNDADTFSWYLKLGTLKNVNSQYFRGKSEFWNNEEKHRSYDKYWQARDLTPYLKNIHIPVLSTGGWWDAEDFYGSLKTAEQLERAPTQAKQTKLVVGPWTHGGWTHPAGATGRSLGILDFGSDTARYWREQVERPWLAHWLIGGPDPNLPAVLSFRTGENRWMRYDRWPPPPAHGIRKLYLSCDGKMRPENPTRSCQQTYTSNPADPVPYLPRPILPIFGGRDFGGTGPHYDSPWPAWEAQDQRFSTLRPDTLLFATAPLSKTVVLTGGAFLIVHVSTTGTDGDFIAKLIDIYPGTDSDNPRMGGYHLMLGHCVLAGRFLGNLSKPRRLIPGHVYQLTFKFIGTDHAFLAGHRVAIELQSTLFPVIARNPQTFVDDVFDAHNSQYRAAKISVHFGLHYTNVLALPEN